MEFGREGMDTMEFLDFTDAGAVVEYERFIQDSKGSFMQSVLWCAVKPDWLHEAVISRDSAGKIAGSMLVLIKRFPPPMKSFLYSPRGPVWDYRNMDVLWDLLRGVWQLSRNYHAYALKADPLIEETDSDRIFALRSAGFTYQPFQEDAQVIQSRNNYLLELRGRNEEELMASFKSKCRYNIKLAQRKGVTCGSYGKERLPEFERLMLETGKRDGFHVRTQEYFARMLDGLGEHCRLYLCDYQGQALSGAVCVQYGGRTCYVYGASTAVHREVMPNYLMQWEMIRWALQSGCEIYDFQGVPCWYDRDNPNYGVYRFKTGFNGRLAVYAGEFRMVFSKRYKSAFDKVLGCLGYQKLM